MNNIKDQMIVTINSKNDEISSYFYQYMTQPQNTYVAIKSIFNNPIQFILLVMGSSHIKDENIQIFMKLDQQFYFSGGAVEGQIYMKVKQPTKCIQQVGCRFARGLVWSGKNRRSYSNSCNSYNSSFQVMNFGNLVQQGDYIFPFSFLLPNMITGSYFHSKHCFLKYTIKCQLVHPTEIKRNQFYSMFLNILEPPRFALGPITTTHTVNSKCCGCCTNYGVTSVTMNCDRNFVLNGDMINITGMVDNTRGTQVIQSTRILLERRRCMVSSGTKVSNSLEQTFLYQTLGPIQPSNSANFNFTAKIPDNILFCTAIGNIVSNYYVLHLYTDYGCCANKAQAQLHLIVHSRTPMIVQPQILPQPSNWYPKVFPKVICQSMNAYLYNPRPEIPFLNIQRNVMTGNIVNQANNMINNNPNNFEEMNENAETTRNNWGQNNTYKPVFYNEELVNDAQRQYLATQQNESSNSTQNQIYRRL